MMNNKRMSELTEYFDPVVAETVSEHQLSMRLHLNLENGISFIRDYYDVTMNNGDLLIYITTNELNANFDYSKYNEEFSFYFSHQHAVEDFRINETLNVYNNRVLESVKNINSIIYYEPEVISRDFKNAIRNELIEQIEGYTERDISKGDKDKIEQWIKHTKQ
ncbi:hypothetical protein AWW68_11550 [Roseivirga spongicola]|uniref:Uncharacterized protein n=2 Tax=Roseivirga spongicola TaxID=333140 RepID=A0A150X3M4_9BACT|nr:hypothetical protein AWW68_11550 [Roseivirga spongicola]